MIARLYMNGRFIGELKYEHPKDPDGTTHVLPRPDDRGTDVQVLVQDENSDQPHMWVSNRLTMWKI